MSTRVERATKPKAEPQRPARRRGQVRELLILLGFVAITGLGIFTVLLPETENEKDLPAPHGTGAAPK